MKKYFFKSFLFASLFALAFVSCSDDDDNRTDLEISQDKIANVKKGAYILNEGQYDKNDAALCLYDINGNFSVADVFAINNNKKKLGDTAQDILISDNKVFITVFGSNVIFVTDLEGKLLKEISTSTTTYKGPRYMVQHGGNVYIDFYSGHLVQLDTDTYEMKVVANIPTYSEQMVVVKDQLYITNSLRNESTPGNTITVIDLKTLETKDPIEIRINPTEILADKSGNIYIISKGNYKEIKSALSVIKANSSKSEILKEDVTQMAINDNTVLLTFTDWNNGGKSALSQYDIAGGKPVDKPFAASDDKEINKLLEQAYRLSVNPENGNIYITCSDYTTTGTILIFSKDGTLKSRISSGGVNPSKAVFFNK